MNEETQKDQLYKDLEKKFNILNNVVNERE